MKFGYGLTVEPCWTARRLAKTAYAPRIDFNIALLVLVGLVLFILVALNSYQNLLVMEETTNLRAQAREGVVSSGKVLSLLKDLETGQRGYILTGDPDYLGPYQTGLAQIGPAFDQLSQQLAHLPLTHGVRQNLNKLIDHRIELARQGVETRRLQGFDEALKTIQANGGRVTMEAIRADFARLDRVLRQEIDARNQKVATLKQRAFWSEGGLTLLGIVLITGAYGLLLREQKRRIRAEHALQYANAHLESEVVHRTAELEKARGEIAAFAQRLDSGIEVERRRLAREVHDQLGQIFTALKMSLNHHFKNVPNMAEPIERMNRLLGDGVATARRIAGELRPPLLDDLGLGAALTHKAQRFSEDTGVQCAAIIEHDERLSPEQATQLYRIVQEALTNVARHADASQVWIEGGARDDQYGLAIEDNGRGILGVVASSLGLLSLRERAALMGGTLELGPGRAGGLRVQVRLPFKPCQEKADADSDH